MKEALQMPLQRKTARLGCYRFPLNEEREQINIFSVGFMMMQFPGLIFIVVNLFKEQSGHTIWPIENP